MLYCEKCGVYLSGSMERCPLCQGAVTGQPEEDAYPPLPETARPYGLTVRLAGLLTAAALTVCAAVNYCFPEGGWWFLFVAAGLGSAWLLTGVALWKRRNPMKAIAWLLAVVPALVLAWDWRTGFMGWSINFVLPCFIPCMQLAAAGAARILRLRPADYLLYLGICILAGFFPLIPLFCGALWMIYPSVVCAGISAISLSALLLFRGPALKAEIIRRGHL